MPEPHRSEASNTEIAVSTLGNVAAGIGDTIDALEQKLDPVTDMGMDCSEAKTMPGHEVTVLQKASETRRLNELYSLIESFRRSHIRLINLLKRIDV
jgi:hypothetical protein